MSDREYDKYEVTLIFKVDSLDAAAGLIDEYDQPASTIQPENIFINKIQESNNG